MRVFVTGASGFIGSAVVRELIGAGHTVTGLARSQAAEQQLLSVGVEPQPGSLADLDALRSAASQSDGVIHLAFVHGLPDAPFRARMHILLGGSPSGIVSRFGSVTAKADRRAIDALGSALVASGRPLVATFGTMGLVPSQRMTENDPPDPHSPGASRAASEGAVQTWADKGVRASLVRLAPSVHGDGKAGFVSNLIAAARKSGSSGYIGDGANRWPAVHRRDAARLFRLALESGVAGARYHGVADEGVALRDIAQVIGRRLDIPTVSVPPERAARRFSWLAPFVTADNPASSRITRERLGWAPTEQGLLSDLDQEAFFRT